MGAVRTAPIDNNCSMNIKVGVVQENPVFFDKEASLEKLASLTETYAARGCELLLFPESFIPGYPRGFSFGATIGERTEEGRDLFLEYSRESVDLNSEDRKFLEELSRKNNVYLAVGVTEKESRSGTLYCSLVYISPSGGLLGVHRKIKPTGTERIIWGEGNGDSLVSFQTGIGKLGGLICWENYMPEARMAMYQKGVEIYLAPTADARDSWVNSLQHIALEGRCFVLGCNQYFTRSMYPEAYQELLPEEPEVICRGGSVIISPMGEILEGPLYDRQGVLIAELNLDEIVRSKLDFDVSGHYSRPDIFEFRVKGQPDLKTEDRSPKTGDGGR